MKNVFRLLPGIAVFVLLLDAAKEVHMASRIAKMIVGLALVVGFSGCTAMTGETAGQNVDDATITASVKSKMAADTVSTLTSVDIDTVRGTVYLTGVVPDVATKERASELAHRVHGVDRVVNNLQTRPIAADAPR